MSDRLCADCDEWLSPSHYTGRQRGLGNGVSRCVSCMHGGGAPSSDDAPDAPDAGRHNRSSQGSVKADNLRHPFAEGTFRWVARGKYTNGPRAGEHNVLKWFKSGVVFSDEFYAADLRAVDKAIELVELFNNAAVIDRPVKVNVPEVWTLDYEEMNDSDGTKSRVLIEPFIYNYQKFNSNTGWRDTSGPWQQVMQALSHFSYHVSGGQYTLCDLQGGIYRRHVIITDPVVLSRRRTYGVTDLGPDGIASFFSNHTCNRFCRAEWTRPADQRRQFAPVSGTTMVGRGRNVPTQASRPFGTRW